jgi:nitroimidazol reductase NimA-like FMN-containing flavoprotein (pyridoxamine 5'-phosphate oxidase superfamily)
VSSERDLGAVARELIDSNLYMTLATADGDGRPWATPVWYAHEGYTDFLWVSRPEARHSRNIASRPQVGIVIFDSTVPVGGAQAVYLEAVAEEVTGRERARRIASYSQTSEAQGAGAWSISDVVAPAPLRLYRAIAAEHFVLEPGDRRVPVEVRGDAEPRSAASLDSQPDDHDDGD